MDCGAVARGEAGCEDGVGEVDYGLGKEGGDGDGGGFVFAVHGGRAVGGGEELRGGSEEGTWMLTLCEVRERLMW